MVLSAGLPDEILEVVGSTRRRPEGISAEETLRSSHRKLRGPDGSSSGCWRSSGTLRNARREPGSSAHNTFRTVPSSSTSARTVLSSRTCNLSVAPRRRLSQRSGAQEGGSEDRGLQAGDLRGPVSLGLASAMGSGSPSHRSTGQRRRHRSPRRAPPLQAPKAPWPSLRSSRPRRRDFHRPRSVGARRLARGTISRPERRRALLRPRSRR